jgi:exopolysaccharide production protein ExoQ
MKTHLSNASGMAMEKRSAIPMPLPSLAATVGAYFAARLCLTYLFFQSDPQMGTIVGFLLNMLLLLVVAFDSFGPAAAALRSPLRVACFRWVAAFLGFSLLSLIWSDAVSVAVAAAYWCGMAADVFMVLLLLRTGPAEDVATRLAQGYIAGACFIACVMWLSPTMQDLRPGNDEFFSPNAIGFTCAFGVFLSQFLLMRSKGWRFPAVFLAISLLRSLSKTTIAAFLISELLLLLLSTTIGRRSKILIVAGSAAVVAAFSGLIAAYYEVYTNAGNQAETLTGRIGIWAYFLDRALERPWLGHGFNSVWKVIPPFGSDQFEPWHAHNELLQQFYAYGVVGIVLLIGLYVSFYRQVRRATRPEHKTLFLGLIVFIAIRGLGDTERFDLSLPLWSIALFCLMLAALEKPSEALA